MRTVTRNILINVSLAALLMQCVEPFEIEIPGGSDFIVVDGLITDQPGPYVVNISVSSPLGFNDAVPVNDASVSVEEEGGITETFTLESPGQYVSSSLQGVAGRRYRLLISTRDGSRYQSDWVTLKPSPPIDSVYWEFDQRRSMEGQVEGVQFFVDTHDPENNTKFYRYRWTETWTYFAPFATTLDYLGDLKTAIRDYNRTCWIDEASRVINLASSQGNVKDVISNQSLNFVSTETNRLNIRYSILVEQLVMNEDEYNYWKGLKETNAETGELFDKQPQSLISNVVNIDNPDETVLGYFSVSGVSTQRVFIQRGDLPEGTTVKSLYAKCELIELEFSDPFSLAEREVLRNIKWGVWMFVNFSGPAFLVTTPECADCTIRGGYTTRPDFWVD